MTFKEILAQERVGNLRRLEARALAANRIVKGLHGEARRLMYEVKHKSLARAVELGAGKLSEVVLGQTSLIFGVEMPREIGGHRFHLPLEAAGAARDLLLAQAGSMIGPRSHAAVAEANRCRAERGRPTCASAKAAEIAATVPALSPLRHSKHAA